MRASGVWSSDARGPCSHVAERSDSVRRVGDEGGIGLRRRHKCHQPAQQRMRRWRARALAVRHALDDGDLPASAK